MQNNNIADHILLTASMIQDNEFVQAMIHMKDKPPSVILYTTQQLDHFLACAGREAVVGIDRTFNLGDFFVTTTVYRCHSVVRREGGNTQIFLGPMYLHWDGS